MAWRCYVARTLWDHVEAQQQGDKAFLRNHGLDKPLRRRLPGASRTGHDWQEIDRQIAYLVDHHEELPRGVAVRRATELLAHFKTGERAPSSKIVLLMGRLLKVESIPIKYAKEPSKLLDAVEYARFRPKASNGEIARYVDVHKSTVGRWRRKGYFK
jgi:hypothetical protein